MDHETLLNRFHRIALAHKVDYIHPGMASCASMNVPEIELTSRPGYGFLSENADFADLCEKNGIKFVGPKAVVIDGLGNKTKARELGEIFHLLLSKNADEVYASPQEQRSCCSRK